MRDSMTATTPLRCRKFSRPRVRSGRSLPAWSFTSRRATAIWASAASVTPARASGQPTTVPNSSPPAPARIAQGTTKFARTNSGT